MSLTLVTAPTVNPVTDSEVYDHLRVPLVGSPAAPVDASHIQALITAAVSHIDGKGGILGRALVTQTWDLKMDRFPSEREIGGFVFEPLYSGGPIRVPLPPLQSVTYIKYIDTDGSEQTLSDTLYTVDTSSEPGRIVPAFGQTWPQTRGHIDDVTVRFVAGYAGDDSPEDLRANVPGSIKAAIKVLVDEMYQNRGDTVLGSTVADLPFGVRALLAPFKVMEF